MFSLVISSCVLSDHEFIKLEISVTGLSYHRASIWRLNNALLSDSEFKQLLSHTISAFKSKIPNFNSLREWWDNLKTEIRNVYIQFCKRKKKSINQERISLTKCPVSAKNDLHASKSGDASIVNSLESQLSSLVVNEAQGAKIRSRAQWFEEGEKPTRYFFRLEQKRAENSTFLSLLYKHGSEKNSQEDLENILVDFYRSLSGGVSSEAWDRVSMIAPVKNMAERDYVPVCEKRARADFREHDAFV